MSGFKTLPRRTFLRGIGAAVALPLLDGMHSTQAAAKAVTPPTRAAFIFFPNGAIMPSWKPTATGADYELSKTLKPLEAFKGDLTVISGLAQDNGRAKGDGPGDHARCAASYLTGAHPVKTSAANIKVGISVDQVAAAQIGNKTRLPSLEIGIERGRNAGNCDSGYSCAYSSNVSWKTPTTPVAKEINPRAVFGRLFGSNEDAKVRKRRNKNRKSILDLVAADAKRLQQTLGRSDKAKLDEYFTSVREIEQRITRAEAADQQRRPKDFPVPAGTPRNLTEHVNLMYDLLVLAFQTDTTRISTYMLGNAGSNRSYPMIKVNAGWHGISHHRDETAKVDQLQRIDQWHVGQFARFLGKLKNVQEGEGTLLDNCQLMYGSGLSDGNRHWHHDLPIVLAGRGGNTLKTGVHLKIEKERPLNDLFLSILDRVGAQVESIGDSKQRLTQIDV
ncbi:MAG: hypothetical protein CMJ65_04455 [Planctomycetaceae bacterium]|nr:hypothetical protein [Planctomycetaceae bacterium]MDP7276033.1 DUF1552 domain-containing protein [Planctomycetaceae bacterium]